MRKTYQAVTAALAIILASGCSTKPRNFAASVSAPVHDRASFEADYRICQNLVTRGHSSNFKGAAVSVLAGGGAFVGVGTALYGAGAMGVSGGAAAVSAAVPVIGVLAGFGVSRAIRSGREKKFKRNMSACLDEYGYTVSSWEKLRKKQDAAAIAATRANAQETNPAPSPETLAISAAPPS